jgi:lipopolysaccharide transport system permease protein
MTIAISMNSSVFAMFASNWRNRALIFQLARREVTGRYKGSLLGLLWSFVNPILMLIIYTFFFSVIFKARWNLPGYENKAGFAVVLFVGLILYGLFAECVNRAPSLIIGNVNYVKRVIFPLEILPCVAMGSALFHAMINVLVLLLVQLVTTHEIQWTVIFLPLIMLPLIFIGLGVSWALASMGVFIRDVSQVTVFVVTVLQFLSPIFYPLSAMPPRFQSLLMLNPLTFIIEQARLAVIVGQIPDLTRLAIGTVVALFFAWCGFWWFQKTRKGFADVL